MPPKRLTRRSGSQPTQPAVIATPRAAGTSDKPPSQIVCPQTGWATHKLVLSMTVMMLQYQITSQMDTQIWLNHYKGDFAAMARTTSMMMSVLMTGGFFVTPLLGAISDCYGRKAQMIIPPFVNLLQRFVLIYTQDVRALFASFVIGGTLASAGMGGWQAAIADLHAGDSAALASASSMIGVGPMLGGMLGPLVGGALGSRDIRLPYAVSAAVCVVACGLVISVPETLPPSARKPIVWRSAGNPLSFMVLFRNGVELATLTAMQVLSNLAQGTYTFGELYRTELLGWGMTQRGRYQSVSMVLSLPGFAAVGPLLRACGSRSAVHLGLASHALVYVFTALSTRGWHFYAIPVLGTASMAASSAIVSAHTHR
jgi:DHA1 family tetracycline resistance protein-like MFS transporter